MVLAIVLISKISFEKQPEAIYQTNTFVASLQHEKIKF